MSFVVPQTVLLPGLGTFRVCHRLHANTVYPTEALYPVFQFHPRFTAQQQDPIPNAGYPVDGARAYTSEYGAWRSWCTATIARWSAILDNRLVASVRHPPS